jgi:SAM-dependent methyltransferase
MDRKVQLLGGLTKAQRGIEIGAYHSPLVPKREGWNTLVMDVFSTSELKRMAELDPNLSITETSRIEDVDLVGPAHRIAGIVDARGELGQFDYIISSHNFEHLPNPIKFLREASSALRPDGRVIMAVPDKRTCFDYYRPVSTLAEMLTAYAEDRERPTAQQVMEGESIRAEQTAFPLSEDPLNITATNNLELVHDAWKARLQRGELDTNYVDAHCWKFTPSTFQLIINDLIYLGYLSYELLTVSETNGNEFYVHLRNTRELKSLPKSPGEFYQERQELLRATLSECARNAPTENGYFSSEQVAALRIELEDVKRHRDALLTSSSWRLTAPLRTILRSMRGRTA